MNKTFCKKNHIFSLILAGCLILFNLSSCGLDTFYVIDAPSNVIHQPQYSSIDYSDIFDLSLGFYDTIVPEHENRVADYISIEKLH